MHALSVCVARHGTFPPPPDQGGVDSPSMFCRYLECAGFAGTLLLGTGVLGVFASRQRSLWLVAVVRAAPALAICLCRRLYVQCDKRSDFVHLPIQCSTGLLPRF